MVASVRLVEVRSMESSQGMESLQGFRGLKVYQLAFNLAMEIFYESQRFPAEEKYSLTDQIRRASRSVTGNIGEGYRKKGYPRMFVSKMADLTERLQKRKCGLISRMSVAISHRLGNWN